MAKFFDFELCIWREGDIYKAEVHQSPAGSCDRKVFAWPFPGDHDELLRDLELAVLSAHGYRGALKSPDETKLLQFGSSVFKAVFRDVPDVQRLYNESLAMAEADGRALRLKLRVDPPELAMLPWEYVYDEVRTRDYVCVDEMQALVRFFFVEGRQIPPRRDERPLRMLAMIANPNGDLDTENERHRINKVFADVPADRLELRWVEGETREALYDALKDGPWDIFHFIGHGGAETVKDGMGKLHTVGYLLMNSSNDPDPKFYASAVAAMLKMGKVRLAVLNCCDSGRGPVSGLGATLVQNTVPLAVAMQFRISDDAALVFSGEFYRALVRGEPVENALTVARTAMYGKYRLEWGIPVLFTRAEPTVMLSAAPSPAAKPTVITVVPPAPAPAPAPAPGPGAVLEESVLPALADPLSEFRRLWRQ